MKILLISQHADPTDGWGTLTRTTALGLLAAGHDVQILLQKPSAALPVTQMCGLPPPLALLDNPLLLFYTAWKILCAAMRYKPDIIHVLTEPYALAMPLLPRRPWVLTACGTYTILPFTKTIPGLLLRRVYAGVDHILSISTYTEKRILQELEKRAPSLRNTVAGKMTVYTLGIEWPQHMPERRDHPEKRIVFVGGVKERKGVRELVEACGVLRSVMAHTFRTEIIGTCPENAYTKALRERISALKLEKHIVIRGQVSADALLQAYADADLFVMLSIPHGMHFEGYGLVFLEANAFGVPVVGPDDSGCTDVIANGISGLTADPRDPHAVAAAMKRILEEDVCTPQSCIHWAQEHSVERQNRETEAIYKRVLA